jgi:adenine-specific DNA-methyltransferase
VQTIYIDPPYGIAYGSNWQMKLNNRVVKDNDEHISGEPEMIKAFRDTWELGIHSYLNYLRDRLLIAKELLSNTGSCFLQISDENIHLVRNIMDEVFGSENFCSLITLRKTLPLGSTGLAGVSDYIIWYAKDKNNYKYRQLYSSKGSVEGSPYSKVMDENGNIRKASSEETKNPNKLPKGSKIFRFDKLTSSGYTSSCIYDFELNGEKIKAQSKSWSTNKQGMQRLIDNSRVVKTASVPNYVRFLDDFPVKPIHNMWSKFQGARNAKYVVQTNPEAIQRCILMSSDPGDLVLDPTCGSGTTAYVAEQWGRRWITIDTSRIALNIAKQRIATADYPYYKMYDESNDIRQGFQYKSVPHITLKSIAQNEPPASETLFDQPLEDKNKIRVAGPFTVETLQNFEPVSPATLDDTATKTDDDDTFEERIFEHLKSAGVKNGIKNEQAVFIRVERLADSYLHAEGFYLNDDGQEQKAYFHIGPKFGTVSKKAVNEAVKSCRQRGDADWLIILGFSFESDITTGNVTTSVGSFEVSKVRMHDDLMQEGLLKKDKKAASFVTIGEPDIELYKKGNEAHVEICGLDIYDPIKDQVKARNVEDIAYWMVDTDYDGSNFVVQQVYFCGGKKDEFKKWRKGLDILAKEKTKKNVERTLKIEIDDEAFDRLYGFKSHPFEVKKAQKVAVRVISQFGEESTKVLTV